MESGVWFGLEEVDEIRYGLLRIFSRLKDGRKSCGTEEVVVFAGGRINGVLDGVDEMPG